MITARAMERGIAKDAPKDGPAQKLAAIKIIDELLMLHPEDEEAWMARGLLAGDGAFTGGKPASAPYYIALTKLNPVHPGANHELLHQYELSKRPALGWVHSVKFIESSPGIPHAWHMQGHLSTRLGRWEEASKGIARLLNSSVPITSFGTSKQKKIISGRIILRLVSRFSPIRAVTERRSRSLMR
ncbi:MAG: hypothetical protein QM703_15570 [Gemmatales bacterium]